MSMRIVAYVLIAVCTLSAVAHAQETREYTYFNKPGSTLAQHEEAVRGCVRAVIGLTPPPDNPRAAPLASYTGLGVAGNAIASDIQRTGDWRSQVRWLISINVENCMLIQGWRVVQLDADAARALTRGSREALLARLEPLVSAETPEGHILREFHAADAPGTLLRPEITSRTPSSLSVTASLPNREMDSLVRERWNRVYSAYVPPPVPDKPFAGGSDRSDDMAFVLASVRGGGDMVVFANDATSQTLVIGTTEPTGTNIYSISPGRWRIAAFVTSGVTVSMCLGSTAFDIEPGDVLYAGAFDFQNGRFTPDLSLAPAEALIASSPDLQATLNVASYVNGVTFECQRASFAYALERMP